MKITTEDIGKYATFKTDGGFKRKRYILWATDSFIYVKLNNKISAINFNNISSIKKESKHNYKRLQRLNEIHNKYN